MTVYNIRYSIVIILFALLSGCQTSSTYLHVDKTLPQSQLEYYQDSFDTFQEGLWQKSTVLMPKAVKKGYFLLGNVSIDNGKLKISTKPDSFSKVTINSKIRLKGDFDIQIDCDVDFMRENLNRDHYFFFINLKGPGKGNVTGISFCKKGKSNPGTMRSGWWRNWKTRSQKSLNIESFHGTIRFIRLGHKVSTLYKRFEKSEWIVMTTFPSATEKCFIVIGLQNFIGSRNLTPAKLSISAKIDNFKINAAENVEEEEI